MDFINTGNPTYKPKVTMLIYGHGGVGKTSAGASAPNPILLDFEGGSKYFGLRGIGIDVAMINTWDDVRSAYQKIKTSKYETVIIDPIGEAMEKLYNDMVDGKKQKLVQPDGQPTMAGWGYLKDNMRRFIKSFRDMDKHLVLIAHVDEKADDEGAIKKRPMIRTKLAQELINLVDMVFYMEVVKDQNGESKRVLRCQPNSDKFEAKDRTGQLGELVEPNVQKIIDAIQGNETFAWMKQGEKSMDKFEAGLDKDRPDENDALNPPAAPTVPPSDPASPEAIAASIPGPNDPPAPSNEMDDPAEWSTPLLTQLRNLALMKLDCNPLVKGDVMRALNLQFGTIYAGPGAFSESTCKVMINALENMKQKSDGPKT